MSSVLKILVDTPCQIYCDYELIGDAVPNSIFRLKLRKGTYILDFKKDETSLFTKEYVMQSNDEEDLLKVELQKIQENLIRELKTKKIANKKVSIVWHDGKFWIKEEGINIETPVNHDIQVYDHCDNFDKSGLLIANYGGVHYGWGMIKGGKYGCINKNAELQIPIIYDSRVYFTNENVAVATIGTDVFFINKWGEIAFENEYDEVLGFHGNFCVVGVNGKFGTINEFGKVITPFIYDEMVPNWNEKVIKARINKFWGFIDYEGNILVPIDYECIAESSDYIIVRHGEKDKYGLLDKSLKNTANEKRHQEIIPCIYDAIYNVYGVEIDYAEEKTHTNVDILGEKIFVIKNGSYLDCYVYYIDKNITSLFNFRCSSFIKEIISVDGKEGLLNYYFSSKGKKRLEEIQEVFALPVIYEKIEKIYLKGHTVYKVLKNNLWGVVSEKGEFLIDCICSEVKSHEYDSIIVVINGNLAVYFFSEKELTIYEEYEEIIDLKNNYLGAKKNGKWAVIYNDHQVTPFEFDKMYDYYSSMKIELVKYIDNKVLYGTFCKEKSIQTEQCIYLNPYFIRKETIQLTQLVEVYDSIKKEECILSTKTGNIIIQLKLFIRVVLFSSDIYFIVGKEYSDINKGNFMKFRIADYIRKGDLLTGFIFDDFDQMEGNNVILSIGNIRTETWYWKNKEKIEYIAPFFKFGYYNYFDDENGKQQREFIDENPFTKITLFLDTETTGFPLSQNASYENFNNWPYLVQVGFILYDEALGNLAERNIMIAPEGYEIPLESTKIHGISNRYAKESGENRKDVLFFMDNILSKVDTIVGHNVDFDINVLKCEILRVKGSEKPLFTQKYHNIIDTMKIGVDICRLPSDKYNEKYKWPKLDELYSTLFNKSFEGQHNAMNDIRATYECYFEMKKRGLI
ncbi:WG containing repeat protein [anaerobic digester metagenome]